MHLVVCAKQIPDPETPPAAFKIDAATNEVVPAQGFQPVLSQFDGIAAEAALQIKESMGDDSKITVLSVGAESAQAAIKQVLAMGADEGVLLSDNAFDGGDSHTMVRAQSLLRTSRDGEPTRGARRRHVDHYRRSARRRATRRM